MIKKLSQQRLALFLSLMAVVAVLIGLLIFPALNSVLSYWLSICILIIGLYILIYLAFQSVLRSYVQRRIRLIYKMIRQSKASSKNREIRANAGDVISKVESDVQTWIEEQQNELRTLKELENYRKNFLGNISHELKTPIFSVQGYIHTLLDGGLNDPEVNRRFLKKAAKNVERLETIIGDLDIIAKLEDATLQLEKQSFDIRLLTQEVIDEVDVQANEQGIQLSFKVGASGSFMVEADREYIRTILINLMVNSIKYGKEGGTTTVGFYDADNLVLIEVADNGIGIKEKHLKHLFDRFYRVDKSRSRNKGGSGLGLSIVKHIIEAHDQTLNVQSTPGLGTTFSFTLDKFKQKKSQ